MNFIVSFVLQLLPLILFSTRCDNNYSGNVYGFPLLQRQQYHHHHIHPRRSTMDITMSHRCNKNDQTYNDNNDDSVDDDGSRNCSRRSILQQWITRSTITIGTITSISSSSSFVVNAFPNQISNQYDDRPKRRGPKPTDLGIGVRTNDLGDEYIGLKTCKVSPNCFSSTISIYDDPDHHIPAWIYPNTITQQQAMEQLYTVIQNYVPGQGNIDGGGFSIIQYDNTKEKAYLYVQFESFKNGYIDDFEAAVITAVPDITSDDDNNDTNKNINTSKNSIQIRSSSRIGYLDYGVNAQRINYIANILRNEYHWPNVIGVDSNTHRNYYIENGLI